MARARWCGAMEPPTMESGSIIWPVAKALSTTLRGTSTLAAGPTTNLMDLAYTGRKMVHNTKGTGRTICSMAKA